MFKFFKSKDSSSLDLKIILKKINNEKTDFHEKNYNIFEVISLIVLLNSLMEDSYYFTRFISLLEFILFIEHIMDSSWKAKPNISQGSQK